MEFKEVKGNLITLAMEGNFNVITHGCNCFCTMGAGIAPQMAKAFGTDKFKMESEQYKGDIRKLGNIDYEDKYLEGSRWVSYPDEGGLWVSHKLAVVNSYTQYNFGSGQHLDYDALALCMKKINHKFKGLHIGLPHIGAGLAGGNWNKIKGIIAHNLKDMDVTIVEYG